MFDALAKSWLALQCQMIPCVTRAIVTLEPTANNALPTASWPEGASTTTELAAAGKLAVTKRTAIVRSRPSAGAPGGARPVVVACPMESERGMFGVVAVELEKLDAEQRGTVVELLRWGSALLEFMLQQGTGAAVAGRLAAVIETTAASLEHRRFHAAATAAATHLAHALSCERVSLGFLERRHVRVQALSHTAKFDRRTSLVRDIETAMAEALDEDAAIVYPAPPSGPERATNAHDRLARRQDDEAICTIPLGSDGRAVGAISFERGRGPQFDPSTVELCEAVATLLGPVLEMKRREDRSLGLKIGDSFAGLLGRLLGPRHLRTKLGFASLLGLVCFLGLASGDYRIAATAALEGTVQRALVAPIDGYIKEAGARAGTVVKRHQVLATLDDEDLKLEHRKWAGKRDGLVNRHRRAIAELDRAEAKILEAQVGKAQAQLDLIEEQLSRIQIIAPFDGLIVTGDLSQSLGAPVERGQLLFELTPLDSYRMALEVDENDIADVILGQRGQLALAAMPGKRFPFVVEQVIGIAQAGEGASVFRVEARLESTSPSLRPGMKGVAKIVVERRNLLWIWTHNLVNRLGLWVWARLP